MQSCQRKYGLPFCSTKSLSHSDLRVRIGDRRLSVVEVETMTHIEVDGERFLFQLTSACKPNTVVGIE